MYCEDRSSRRDIYAGQILTMMGSMGHCKIGLERRLSYRGTTYEKANFDRK